MLGAGGSSASAARQPTAPEGTAITRAVEGFYEFWWYYRPSGVPGLRVTHVRVSTASSRWAAADVSGPRVGSRPVLADRVLLWHSLQRWIVADAPGSEFIGCRVAPPAVTRDLCPGTGGC